MSDDKKVIFSMQKLSKTYSSSDKQVLKNIYLSFFYGAKIGILGLNGSGKSSLLRIIAGVDKNYQGDIVFAPGYTVGYLEQEPQLDDSKTVIEIVREGVAETMAVLGGAGSLQDIGQLIHKFGIIGAAAGSLFVFVGKYKAVLINYPKREEKDQLIKTN